MERPSVLLPFRLMELPGAFIDDEPDELSNLLADEDLPSQEAEDHRGVDDDNYEKKTWMEKSLDHQCIDVLTLLSKNERRWDTAAGSDGPQVLEQYKKTTIGQKIDTRDRGAPTALHVLAKYSEEFGNLSKQNQNEVVGYLLLCRGEELFGAGPETRGNEDLFLKTAMTYQNNGFIDCVDDCLGDKFPDLLDLQDGEGKNFFHHMFTLDPPKQAITQDRILYLVDKLVPKARPDTLATADKTGNTPVHYAMHYSQNLNKPREYIETIKKMILRADPSMRKKRTLFNDNNESPVRYYWNRVAEMEAARNPARQVQSNTGRQIHPGVPRMAKDAQPQSNGKRMAENRAEWSVTMTQAGDMLALSDNAKKPMAKNPKMEIGTALPPPSRSPMTDAIAHYLLSNGHRPQSPALTTASKPIPATMNAKRSRDTDGEKLPKKSPPRDGGTSDPGKPAREIRSFITMHYIRTRSDMDARDLLFRGKVSEINKNLSFDARGQQDAKKMVDLLNRLSVGGFNNTLAYVNIPTVNHSSAAIPSAKPSNVVDKVPNPTVGRSELVEVFDTLHKLGVTKILRLFVEDRQPPSHMDAAIERALQGRDSLAQGEGKENSEKRAIHVETWDWRKPDLSTDVIAFAVPSVEHVNLYWSGNQAVLRGWDCDEGIPRLYVRTEGRLKTVTVHAAPGLETRERMDVMLKRFKEEVIRKTSAKLGVKIVYRMEGLLAEFNTGEETADPVIDNMDASEKQHVWVDTMDKFRKALSTLPNISAIGVPRVKLAIIDDGIDLGSLDMYNGIVRVTGRSFFPKEYGCENHWHCSSSGHGTILANMIVRINPWVELYIIRVQDVVSRDGGRNIFAKSAARAIKAAVELGVNIISMSWTIKNRAVGVGAAPVRAETSDGSVGDKPKPEPTDIQKLETAIDEAKEAGILMFCSASDDILASAMDTLPYRRQPEYIFRIGAALPLGQRDPHSEDVKRIDYIFPGYQVAEARNPRSVDPVKYHDGSSVGTALAAGLASLVIYCARLAQYRYEDKKSRRNSSERNPYANVAAALRGRPNMKRALDNVKKNEWQAERKFLPVWFVFKPIAEAIENAKTEEDKWDAIEKLVDQLRYGID